MKQISFDMYKQIRYMYAVKKMSQRAIAKELGINRNTVSKYCEGATTPGERKGYESVKTETRLNYEKMILELLEADIDSPKKQKLNAKSIHKIFIKKGYAIGESTVRKYIKELQLKKHDVFIPLDNKPGEKMEVDWGDANAVIGGVKTPISVFCTVLPYSYHIFCAVFPHKKFECFLKGHEMAFAYHGGTPKIAIYDNLKSAVNSGSGANSKKQENFMKLESHYAFHGVFCNAHSGWEKGNVENLVSIIRKIAFVPIPKVESWEELQEHVTTACNEYNRFHKIKYHPKSIAQMFEEEKEKLSPLPLSKIELNNCIETKVRKDLTVVYDGIHYSVPEKYVGLSVVLQISPFNIDIYHNGELIYHHIRGIKKNEHQYVLEHYLDLLNRKHRAIDDALPVTKGILPPELEEFRKLNNDKNKNKQIVDILLLTRSFPEKDVMDAVAKSNMTKNPEYDNVLFFLDIAMYEHLSEESKTIEEISDNKFDGIFSVKDADLKALDALIPNNFVSYEKDNYIEKE